MKRKKKKSIFLRRMSGLFGLATAFAVLFYLAMGTFLDRDFIGRDMKEKRGQVAGVTMLSVRFVGPPNQPELTANPLCENYSPYIALSWTTDDQMDYFDLERNSAPLIAGIIEDAYDDETVEELTGYIYRVTAFNELGETASDPVSAATSDCGVSPELPDPTCSITRFDDINLAGFSGTPDTEERKPEFQGTTNMPGARIEISIGGETLMTASILANENGYWSWKPLDKLNYGTHTFSVTAIDPENSTRRKSASLNFEIEEEEEEEKDKKKKKKEDVVLVPPADGAPKPSEKPEEAALRLKVEVKNPEKIVFSGRNLEVETTIAAPENGPSEETELEYILIDRDGREVFRDADRVNVGGRTVIEKKIKVPRLLKPGKYRIIAKVEYNGIISYSEDNFFLEEFPLVNLGGGMAITTGQIMRNMFWIILGLLLLLLVFLLFLLIEHWLSRRAIIHINERNLKKQGFIK